MKFTWGTVIHKFEYDFDGKTMEVTKYHPWKTNQNNVITGIADVTKILYHCEELRQSSSSLQVLIISWIAYINLGLNEGSLVCGIAKALDIYKTD